MVFDDVVFDVGVTEPAVDHKVGVARDRGGSESRGVMDRHA